MRKKVTKKYKIIRVKRKDCDRAGKNCRTIYARRKIRVNPDKDEKKIKLWKLQSLLRLITGDLENIDVEHYDSNELDKIIKHLEDIRKITIIGI